MRRFFACIMLLAVLTAPVSAADLQTELVDAYDVESLEDGLTPQEKELLGGVSPTAQHSFPDALLSMLETGFRSMGQALWETKSLLVRLLLVVILCQMTQCIGDSKVQTVAQIAGGFAVASLCLQNMTAMIGLGRDTIERLSAYSNLLLPVMTSVAAAAGAVTGSGAIYALTVFFSNLFLSLSSRVLMPTIYAYIGLSVADCVSQQDRLQKMRELLKWLIEIGMKGIAYGFAAIVSVTGILSGNTDAVTMRGIKTAVSTMVPVVGKIISGAADTVLNGALLLKNTVGLFGMLAVLAICLLPFLRLGISWVLLRAVTAVTGMLGSKLSGLIEAVSSMMGMVLGMIGCASWIMLISCFCYLKVVSP